ncbi:ABC transporter ATP-binding protein/permease [Pararhodospirillum photometricum]|uniref:ABC transporter, transmembrane region n=1 Tax=Pararhodospirillum photometricum DSM 122 TaxID=1150469 RepID=H6SSK3_PARPM|nr:ABC transporter transmembrane domain-containing protein [Pararhodospirillum photometricum]CCG07882.1 ABC transporter, transmembrane region [Pararhodospirillum photometricum DSM 122]
MTTNTPGAGEGTPSPDPAKALLQRVGRELRPLLWALAGVQALAGGLLIALAWLLAGALNDVVIHGQQPEGQTLAWVAGLGLTRALALGAGAWLAGQLGARAGLALRRRLVGTALPAGEAAFLVVEGVEAVEPFFARYWPASVQAVLLPFAVLAVVVPLDGISAAVLAVTAPLIPLFMVLIGDRAGRLNVAQWAAMTRLSAYFLDVVRALPVLRAFGAVAAEATRLGQGAQEWRDVTVRVLRVAFLSSLVLEFLATLGIALVAVFIGFRLFWGEMGYERGLFLLLLAPEFYAPLRQLGAHYHARMEALAAAQRLDAPPRDLSPSAAEPSRPPRTQGARIEMQGVRFRHPGGGGVEDLSLVLEPGSLTVVVGPSGAGKSTLLGLLRGRLSPQAGQILVEGRPLEGERDRPMWVPQQPHLFAGSLEDVLRLGGPDASPAALVEALRLAAAEEVVAAKAGGGWPTGWARAASGFRGARSVGWRWRAPF